jgi:hypothetical protein
MAKLPRRHLPENVPDTSLGLGRLVVNKWNPWLLENNRLRGTAFAPRQEARRALISNLARSVALLTAHIEHEEMRSGVRNLADPAYPVRARSLRERRENIGATIASLEALVQGTPEAA